MGESDYQTVVELWETDRNQACFILVQAALENSFLPQASGSRRVNALGNNIINRAATYALDQDKFDFVLALENIGIRPMVVKE